MRITALIMEGQRFHPKRPKYIRDIAKDRGALYCVYIHRYKGRPFYVGSGHIDRAVNTTDRSGLWSSVASRQGGITVEIVRWFQTVKEARAAEERLIVQMKPAANTKGKNCVRCSSCGQVVRTRALSTALRVPLARLIG